MDDRRVPPDWKPSQAREYPQASGDLCERTLVSLLRGIGPWKKSIVLIGGLAPRYLVRAGSTDPHIGTLDIDLVIGVELIADTEAYLSLEKNLKRMGFERTEIEAGRPRHFQWRRAVDDRHVVIVELLCDAEDSQGGRPISLPGERRLSALGTPGAQLALDDFIEIEVTAPLLDDRGTATETIRVCGIVPFLVLKLRAYDDRFEIKDAYDIIYCLMNVPGGPAEVGRQFAERIDSDPKDAYLRQSIQILRSRFAGSDGIPGSDKDGPTSYARFLASPDDPASAVLLRQDAAAVVELFLSAFGAAPSDERVDPA